MAFHGTGPRLWATLAVAVAAGLGAESSGTIVVFRIDPATGAFEATGRVVAVPSPCCVEFVPISD